jgi:hypothetical protein
MLGPVITTVTAKRSSLTINNITLAPTFTVSSRGHSGVDARFVFCREGHGPSRKLGEARLIDGTDFLIGAVSEEHEQRADLQ